MQDIFRTETDLFRYEEPAALSGEQPPKPAPPKPVKPPKPAAKATASPMPIRKQSPLGFYSPLHEAVASWPQPKGTPQQLLAHLTKHAGANQQGQIHGFHEALSGKPQVSRDEAMAAAGEMPELTEHSQINPSEPEGWLVRERGENQRTGYREYEDEESARQAAERMNAQGFEQYDVAPKMPEGKTHFGTWQLPGPSSGYDEMHIAAPGVKPTQKPLLKPEDFTTRIVKRPDEGKGVVDVHILNKDGSSVGSSYRTTAGDIDSKNWINSYVNNANKHVAAMNASEANWEDGHSEYEHIANPVVRARFNTRKDADGNKMLFMEELQGPNDANQEKMPSWLKDRIYDIGMKRMLRKAADEGYDKIGWTTGNHQADRYSLRKQVDKLEWEPTGELAASGGRNIAYGNLVGIKDGKQVVAKKVDGDELASFVGKDLANKLLTSQPEKRGHAKSFYDEESGRFRIKGGEGTVLPAGAASFKTQAEAEIVVGMMNKNKAERTIHSVEGDDLEVGGNGLKRLYDHDLPAKAMKLLKRAGAKVETSEIHTDKGQEAVHSITLTPEARKLIQGGFSLYSMSGEPVRYEAGQEPESDFDKLFREGHNYFMNKFGLPGKPSPDDPTLPASDEPLRYADSMIDIVRQLPRQDAAIYAFGVLQLLKVRPDLVTKYDPADLAFLRSLAQGAGHYSRAEADAFAV